MKFPAQNTLLFFIILSTLNSYTYIVKLNLLAYHSKEAIKTKIINNLYSVGTFFGGKEYPSSVIILSSRDKLNAIKKYKTIVRSQNLAAHATRQFNFIPKKDFSKRSQVKIISGNSGYIKYPSLIEEHYLKFDFATTLCVLNLEISSRVFDTEVVVDVFVSCANEEAFDPKTGALPNSNELSTMFRVNDKLF